MTTLDAASNRSGHLPGAPLAPSIHLSADDIDFHEITGRSIGGTDVESAATFLTGRRVLVTGAGGSIGSELCRQIARFRPSELIMLDRDETGLQQTQVSLSGHGLLDSPHLLLADIRDGDALTDTFVDRKPDVVFHAAALKHLPLLERYPDEAWKTNVLGTLNVLRASRAAGAERFVNISTDKAANPTSTLGSSKHLAERLTAAFAGDQGERYASVRFGNVFASRGSLVPLLVDLINAGKPVTVTHPDATRYFMSIPEASQLVIHAGAIAEPGEILVLDMGQPVRILDVVNRVIEQTGRPTEIIFTGLRPGEKIHEELIGAGEIVHRSKHPKISHTRVEPLAPEDLDRRLLLGYVPRGSSAGCVRGDAQPLSA
ncbi:UDP-N-acetylglucosamine 4,6-dehydratase family protein [Frondihabitans australicus]|uniref:Polysaccharide biosynthesis protein n=1 Tax=Frondihabitans australicus TaxID=386892 RepID=A0A495ILX4_9MICO|nr:polysaccharide biosynthesis protein [Frondihabitans australicus]